MGSRSQPTERFTTRVENYLKYRPHYPGAILDLLRDRCGLIPESVVADIGSGTGYSAELFVQNGNIVYAVEPNPEMRAAGERYLSGLGGRFASVSGTGEETGLPDVSIDFIVAAQSFHWFDRAAARAEWKRILRPGGWAVLLWNDRQVTTPFSRSYEQLLLDYATDYVEVRHQNVGDDALKAFFGLSGVEEASFRNVQRFDFQGLEGRLLSSSYAPEPAHPQHAPMRAELRRIFEAHQVDGRVDFQYLTLVYYGHLS